MKVQPEAILAKPSVCEQSLYQQLLKVNAELFAIAKEAPDRRNTANQTALYRAGQPVIFVADLFIKGDQFLRPISIGTFAQVMLCYAFAFICTVGNGEF